MNGDLSSDELQAQLMSETYCRGAKTEAIGFAYRLVTRGCQGAFAKQSPVALWNQPWLPLLYAASSK